MNNKVFKFGGASIKDADGIISVGNILNHFENQKITCVVSASGKTTNAMEDVVNAYFNKKGNASELLNEVKQNHLNIIKDCNITNEEDVADIMDSFVEVDWVIEEEVQDSYDYIYDQVVSVGEILSSKILYYYLKKQGENVRWLDVRGVLFTDEIHREAKVDWEVTLPKINSSVNDLFKEADLIITQGFIGSTQDNLTTTLGREGSDYTAAIFSYCTDAEGMHIWKDVPGVLTGDPRIFENVSKINRLSYKEAIEMTYYGAKVIHPKTIKPIQNKSIPLYVRPFNDPSDEGTIISEDGELSYPPIVVIEPDQCLLHISVNDFSFVAEHHMSNIFSILSELRLKVNLMRNTAISFSLCVQNRTDKIAQFKDRLKEEFTVIDSGSMELITIRHYNDLIVEEMKAGKLTIFEERLNDMIQIVVKNIPMIKRKS